MKSFCFPSIILFNYSGVVGTVTSSRIFCFFWGTRANVIIDFDRFFLPRYEFFIGKFRNSSSFERGVNGEKANLYLATEILKQTSKIHFAVNVPQVNSQWCKFPIN